MLFRSVPLCCGKMMRCVFVLLCVSVALGKPRKQSAALAVELANLEHDIQAIHADLEEPNSSDELDDPFNIIVSPASRSTEMPTVSKLIMYLSLFFTEKIKGKIESDTSYQGQIVFSGSSDEKKRLLRMMWWGSQYGYSERNHYKPKGGQVETIPINNEDIFIRESGRDLADARAVMFFPGDFTIPGDSIPVSSWYCAHVFGDESDDFCRNAVKIHVTFRGMQLSLGMTTPPVDDLVNMRGLTTLEPCSFTVRANLEDIPVELVITQGTCKLLQSLLKPTSRQMGLLDSLFREVGAIAKNPSAKVVVFMQGLSFGGALAQAAGVLFAEVVRQAGYPRGVDVRCAIATFGSPRVGGAEFSDQANDLIVAGGLVSNQYIMYTYYTDPSLIRKTTDAIGWTRAIMELHYDPIAMWPPELYPIGNQYTLLYHKSGEHLVTEVRQDLRVSRASFNLEAASDEGMPARRRVPNSSMKTFYCLHLFPLYKNFLEDRESPQNWCDGNGRMRVVEGMISRESRNVVASEVVLRDGEALRSINTADVKEILDSDH